MLIEFFTIFQKIHSCHDKSQTVYDKSHSYLICYVEQPTTCKDAKPSQNPEWAVSGQLWSKEACDSGKQTFQLCSQSVLILFNLPTYVCGGSTNIICLFQLAAIDPPTQTYGVMTWMVAKYIYLKIVMEMG